nr:uncharacterized protein LOC112283543 [Physcomitrium patens]|eukprot:XP_024378127.1 uncharacterized protein LOC112283543 [Physcomitrella patens]
MGGKSSKPSSSNAEVHSNSTVSKSKLSRGAISRHIHDILQKQAQDERLKNKIKIRAILDKNFNWDVLDADEIVDIFTKLLAKDTNKMLEAWTSWRLKPHGSTIEGNMVLWNPTMYRDNKSSLYASYFPCVINKIEQNPIVGFNPNSRKWFGLPKLDFLPLDVNDIIAGDGGLLCVNGGLQPRMPNPQTPPIPHSQDYNHVLYPPQSILLVCNPLTKKIKYIPLHSNKTLDAKIALMITMAPPPSCGEDTKILLQKKRYRLYVVGSHCENSTPFKKGCNELVFMAYDSRHDMWVSGSFVGQCRFPKSGKTSIAIIDVGYMVSGQKKVSEGAQACKIMVSKSKDLNSSLNESEPHKNMPLVEKTHTWKNKLFFIHKPTLKWHIVDFDILDSQGFPRKHMQAPRLLQCRPQGKVYALTRSIIDPCTIEVYEVLVSNGLPLGEYLQVTMMPKEIYNALFNDLKTIRQYDCCASLNFLCFLIPKDMNTATTIAIYDITTKQWSTTFTPDLSNQCGNCTYSFAKCEWIPNWQASP